MKITVRLFAFFREGRFIEEQLEYPDRTTVAGVINDLGIDINAVGVTMISSRHCPLDAELRDGDQLGIFPMIGGG
ncbi:MAG: MoaD/ThiS family protein [Desulfocapsaceae bacterium]|nr:MoaD/ThiS family protein [Desulfocapsaceae bacterium]